MVLTVLVQHMFWSYTLRGRTSDMVQHILGLRQVAPTRSSFLLRFTLIVGLGLALLVTLLIVSAPALLALQQSAFALLAPYFSHAPAHASSGGLPILSCSGALWPCQ